MFTPIESEIMRRQWPCSICGFACSSTWRNLHPSRPVICNTCKSKEKSKIVGHNITPQMETEMNNTDQGAKNIGPSENLSFNDHHHIVQNMTFAVSQFGMIFGKLPFEAQAIPVNVDDGQLSQKPTLKSLVVKEEEHCEVGFQDQYCCGSTSLKTSTSVLESGDMIHIKHEYDCQQTTIFEAKKLSFVWDTNKVQKKRRSKLPQYSLSPLSRLIKQLHYVYHSNVNKISTARRAAYDRLHKHTPKFDDVLIYEKCMYVAENEIGIGAKMLSPSINSSRKKGIIRSYESEYSCGYTTSFSANESDATYSNCLIDVPILTSNPSA